MTDPNTSSDDRGNPAAASGTRDGRRPAFCYQTHDALDAIRNGFESARLSTALAIYLCLTETANRHGGAAARNGFRAARAEIAERAGVSVNTLTRYTTEFEQMGLIAVERQSVGKVNLPNVWVLADPPPPTDGATLPPPVRPLARAIPSREEVTPKKEVQEPRARAREHWLNLPGMTQHRESYFDSKINRKLDRAIAKYGIDDVCSAMTAYCEVLASDEHYWSHRWTLGDFLTRGLDRFVPEAKPYNTFMFSSKNPGELTAAQHAAIAAEERRQGR